MIRSRFDPPRLAKAIPQTWIPVEEATTLLRERLGLPPFARADAQGALFVLTSYGFAEQSAGQVRRSASTPDWPPKEPEPKPTQFIPIAGTDQAPERIIEIKAGTIASAPWASAFVEKPVVHADAFPRPE
jgi:hypothetical protein